jgi:hypothetical protein
MAELIADRHTRKVTLSSCIVKIWILCLRKSVIDSRLCWVIFFMQLTVVLKVRVGTVILDCDDSSKSLKQIPNIPLNQFNDEDPSVSDPMMQMIERSLFNNNLLEDSITYKKTVLHTTIVEFGRTPNIIIKK